MAKTRVGINGFGRIGRNFFRAHLERGGDFEIVAINDLGDAKTMEHLLKYDSVLGTLDEDVEVGDGLIKAGKTELQVLSERDPAGLPWGDLKIELGFMTTIHAYTNDQQILDLPHKDLRRARAAAINLIPTSTGAARAIGLVMPDLKGKVDGISVRAPVPTGSITDLVVRLGRDVTVDQINEAYRAAASGDALDGILRYADDPLVSTDIVHSQYSCIVDSQLT